MVGEDDPKAYRWHLYCTLLVWGGGILLVIPVVLFPDLSSGGLLGVLYLPFILAIFIVNIAALAGYYKDAKYLGESEAPYKPLWFLWVLAHLFLGAPLVAPAYLLRRRMKLGKNDYSGTLVSRARDLA